MIIYTINGKDVQYKYEVQYKYDSYDETKNRRNFSFVQKISFL